MTNACYGDIDGYIPPDNNKTELENIDEPIMKVYWTTKRGTKIDVDLMTKKHLQNTLKMLIKNNWICMDNDINASEIDLY